MMEAMLKKSAACAIFALFAGTIISVLIVSFDAGLGDRSDASIQGGAVNIVVAGPKNTKPDGNFQDLVATEELFWYNATVPAYPDQSEIYFRWEIETELGTILYAEGPSLKYMYYVVGNYTINVTARLPDNSTGWKLIEVSVTLDYDGDGIADAWERKWFGSTALVDETTDHDGDGWTDLEEYRNGTNPKTYTYKPGFLDQYWWLIALIVAILIVAVIYLGIIRPKIEAKRKEEEQKKIAAAVEIEKTLLGIDELEKKEK
jgi:hypothetical protein